MSNLSDVLRDTIHRYPRGIKILADLLGKSPQYLYRAYLDGDSGRSFDVRLLVPLMKTTDDLSVLHYMASLFDLVLVQWPQSQPSESDLLKVSNRVQKNWARFFNALLIYKDTPSLKNRSTLQKHITSLVTTLSGLHLRLKHTNQEVLPL